MKLNRRACIIAAVALLAAPLIIVLAVNIYSAVINATQPPSLVDVSPLALLSQEQVERADDVFARLEDSELIPSFRVLETPLNRRLDRTYYLRWRRVADASKYSASLHITAWVHSEDQTSADSIGSHRQFSSGRSTVIRNDNGTEAVLQRPYMPTTAMNMPTEHRLVFSRVRVGNLDISMSERRHRDDTRELLSSQFITLLVETLQEE